MHEEKRLQLTRFQLHGVRETGCPLLIHQQEKDGQSSLYVAILRAWKVVGANGKQTQGIDDVHRATAAATDPEVIAQGKHIVSELGALKYELQHDRILTPLPDDGQPDIAGYNKELEQLSKDQPLKWLDAPWLFSECYMYRYNCPSMSKRKEIAYGPRTGG